MLLGALKCTVGQRLREEELLQRRLYPASWVRGDVSHAGDLASENVDDVDEDGQ